MLSAKNNYKLSSKYSAALKLSLARLKALVKLNNNFTYIFYKIFKVVAVRSNRLNDNTYANRSCTYRRNSCGSG